MWKYKQRIRIIPDTGYHMTEFRFFDHHQEEIKL
jgi:ribonuclease G